MSIDALPVVATAIPIGIAFGFILERAGLGDPRVIAGQLIGRDFTVIRVMFGAIVTAMLGVLWGGALGVIDIRAIAIPPTDLAAQALGAVIFGGGFALAALCPGTACVAAASGRRDGLVAVAGVFMGTLVTPALWPALGAAAATAPREGARLPDDLGIPIWAIALVLTALAILASAIARRVERPAAAAPWWHLTRVESVALTLAVAFAATHAATHAERLPAASLASIAGEISREQDHVDPLDLATWIRDRRDGLRVLDVREGLDSGTYVIPGAETVPLDRIASLRVAPGEQLVLYSDGGTHAAQAWVLLRARGVTNVFVLKDGMAAWEDDVLSPRIPPASDTSAQRRFKRARELSLWFGGRPRLPAASAVEPAQLSAPVVARPRRRNTC
jgi:rhodanese-related sulfurtransferase/uncharacterized membrane protein YedE/YeeE